MDILCKKFPALIQTLSYKASDLPTSIKNNPDKKLPGYDIITFSGIKYLLKELPVTHNITDITK
jgi:hypothetical protein